MKYYAVLSELRLFWGAESGGHSMRYVKFLLPPMGQRLSKEEQI